MPQPGQRRPSEKPAANRRDDLRVGTGDHLDLGMTVTVYCAEYYADALRPCESKAETGPAGATPFTEH